MSRAYLIAVAVIAIVCWIPASALAASGPGSGLGSGVHVDPGSPAGKEYAIPLGTARGGTPAGSGKGSHLFGAGITKAKTSTSTPAPAATSAAPTPAATASTTAAPSPAASATAASHTGSVHHRARHRTAHRSGRQRGGRRTVAATPPSRNGRTPSPQSVIGTNASSGTGIGWMLAAAVLVVVLGGIGGFALTRRGRSTDTKPYPS